MRILSKWCEELLKNFDPEYLKEKQSMFKMRNGKSKYLEPHAVECLNSILQCSKKNILNYIKKVMKNSYDNQSHFACKDISQNLKKFSKEEAIIGEFTSAVFLSNQNYIIGYLNVIIHSLMDAV